MSPCPCNSTLPFYQSIPYPLSYLFQTTLFYLKLLNIQHFLSFYQLTHNDNIFSKYFSIYPCVYFASMYLRILEKKNMINIFKIYIKKIFSERQLMLNQYKIQNDSDLLYQKELILLYLCKDMKAINKAFMLLFVTLSLAGAQKITIQNQTGKAITPEVQRSIATLFQTAYIYYAQNITLNVQYIRFKITDLYPGNWLILITPKTGNKIGLLNYTQINEWWLDWSGVNRFEPNWQYILYRYLPWAGGRQIYYSAFTFEYWQFGNGLDSHDQMIIKNIESYAKKASTDIQSYMKIFQQQWSNYQQLQGYWNYFYFSIVDYGASYFPIKQEKWFIRSYGHSQFYILFLT